MTRLHAPAEKGATEIFVDIGMDLVPDDELAIGASSHLPHSNDLAVVKTYDKVTGKVELKEALWWYHWGKSESTVEDYSVDVRAEVSLLSRNVKINADKTPDGWGGQVLTGKFLESDLTERTG
jgi:hypothetical protein